VCVAVALPVGEAVRSGVGDFVGLPVSVGEGVMSAGVPVSVGVEVMSAGVSVAVAVRVAVDSGVSLGNAVGVSNADVGEAAGSVAVGAGLVAVGVLVTGVVGTGVTVGDGVAVGSSRGVRVG
jgi:hypothetical protein